MNNFLKWATWGVGISAVILIILIQLGTFDIPTIDDPVEITPKTVTAPSQSFKSVLLKENLPRAGTLRLLLSADGAEEAQYGLLLRQQDIEGSEIFNIGLTPTGFVELLGIKEDQLETIMPLQPWPHIKENQPNEIWLNWENETASIYINRELLMSVETMFLMSGAQVYLYADSFSDEPLILSAKSAP